MSLPPQRRPVRLGAWRVCMERSGPLSGRPGLLGTPGLVFLVTASTASRGVISRARVRLRCVCHSPSAILCLPALVSRSSPGNSSMYPSWISRSLCSGGIVRCIGPLAQLRSDTNSSWVTGGTDEPCAIPQVCARNRPFSSSQSPTIKLTGAGSFDDAETLASRLSEIHRELQPREPIRIAYLQTSQARTRSRRPRPGHYARAAANSISSVRFSSASYTLT